MEVAGTPAPPKHSTWSSSCCCCRYSRSVLRFDHQRSPMGRTRAPSRISRTSGQTQAKLLRLDCTLPEVIATHDGKTCPRPPHERTALQVNLIRTIRKTLTVYKSQSIANFVALVRSSRQDGRRNRRGDQKEAVAVALGRLEFGS